MTSATNIPVHVKKNRTAGDWAILILLIVGGLVMIVPVYRAVAQRIQNDG